MLPDNPTLEEYIRLAEQLAAEGFAAFAAAATAEILEERRVEYLGDKSGKLRYFRVALGTLPKEAFSRSNVLEMHEVVQDSTRPDLEPEPPGGPFRMH